MSIVVAVQKKRRIVMAADSRTNFGNSSTVPEDNGNVVKISRIGDSLLGKTGWGIYENILDDYVARQKSLALHTERAVFTFFCRFWKGLHDKYPFVNDQCEEGDHSPFGNLDASFLLANRRGIFFVASDTSVSRFDKYFAIGSGAEYALGALHVLYEQESDVDVIARRAVETACTFNVFCGGRIDVMHPGR